MMKVGDKYKTRDGHDVEITEISDKGTHPILGLAQVWRPISWTREGKWKLDGDHNMDIMINLEIER